MTIEQIHLIELAEENARLRRELEGSDIAMTADNRTALFVGAGLSFSALGVVAMTFIVAIAPPAEHTPLIATVVGFLVPSVSACMLAAVQQLYNGVNGRFSQLLRVSRTAARAEGILIAAKADVDGQRKQP